MPCARLRRKWMEMQGSNRRRCAECIEQLTLMRTVPIGVHCRLACTGPSCNPCVMLDSCVCTCDGWRRVMFSEHTYSLPDVLCSISPTRRHDRC